MQHPSDIRSIFCNRSLNLRSIKAVGYDMDYTLVHYAVEAWETAAYEHLQRKLTERGWPIGDLRFDPEVVNRGLIIDRERGNLLKANRFGYVKHAAHGTRALTSAQKKDAYSRTVVDTTGARFVFLNTLFSISEAAMYAQAVDLLDAHALPEVLGYADLHHVVRSSLDEAHMEGRLKAEIMERPERFVMPDPDLGQTLLDQKTAGLKLMVITNSDWAYTRFMLGHVLDPLLPGEMTWRDLFDLVIVSARKPDFFGSDRLPAFNVIDEAGLLRPVPGGIAADGHYVGGNAAMVERHLGLDGSEILYVGDHVYADVLASKSVRRWRTALILRELEAELHALAAFSSDQEDLARLMARKAVMEHEISRTRLRLKTAETKGDDERSGGGPSGVSELRARMEALRLELRALNARIKPLAAASDALGNERWGPIMRAGNDKSYLTRQLEQFADVYTSRVSNFLHATPYANFRSPYGSLPHDSGPEARSG